MGSLLPRQLRHGKVTLDDGLYDCITKMAIERKIELKHRIGD
jgi:hypothetical protein